MEDHQHTASSLNYHEHGQTIVANKLPAKKKKKERITLNNLQLVFLIQANRWVRKGKAGDQGYADKHRTRKHRSTTVCCLRLPFALNAKVLELIKY